MNSGDIRTAPASLEAERAALGAILLDNSAIKAVAEIVSPEDFFGEKHQLIFAAMLDCENDKSPIDAMTLCDALGGDIERAGGISYLSELSTGLPRATNAASYAAIVRAHADRRRLARLGEDLRDAALNGKDATDLLAAIAASTTGNGSDPEELITAELRRQRIRQEARRRLDAERSETQEARSWSLEDILADPSRVELPAPVVPMMAWPGRATLFVAPEKLGKSTKASAASAAVSSGVPWLGQDTTAGPVLWAAEESPGDVARRLRDFGARPDAVTIMTWGSDPIAEIRAEVERVSPVLTVVDTLQAIAEHARPESGSGSQWAAIMRPLVRIARDTGTALVILHHARRSDGAYRDSSEIAAAVDVIVEMSGSDTDTLRRLAWRGRYGRGKYAVRLCGHRYELLQDDDGNTLSDEIIGFVKAHPGTGSSAVVDAVTGRAGDVRSLLAALVGSGRLLDAGTTRQHRYRVPSGPSHAGTAGPDDESRPSGRPARPEARTGGGTGFEPDPDVGRPGPTHRWDGRPDGRLHDDQPIDELPL